MDIPRSRNLANSTYRDTCSCLTIRTVFSVYPGSECWKHVSLNYLRSSMFFLQFAKRQFTCSPFTLRRNSQLVCFHLRIYLFQHLVLDVSFEINIMSFTSLPVPSRQPLHETFVTSPHPSMPDTEINLSPPSGQPYMGFDIILTLS